MANKHFILHSNKWYWGRKETIVLNGGVAICDVSVGDDDLSVAYLTDVKVLPEYRGRGWGNELLQWAEIRAMAMGASELYLEADSEYFAMAWYRRHGFKVLGRKRNGIVKMYKKIGYGCK